MTAPSWPSTVSYTDHLRDYFAEVADAVMHGPRLSEVLPEDAPAFTEYAAGDGRVVYDISDHTNLPAVLRVAYNDVGVRETQMETNGRESFPSPLRERLVPVLDHGHGYQWSVQPKCESIPAGQTASAVEELTELAEEAHVDTREVYARNVGYWGGIPVLYDYGGL